MNKHIKPENRIVRLLFIAAFALLMDSDLKGQPFLKKMGNGLDAPVNCACSDSVGNIYAVTSKVFDSAIVWKWDQTKWSVFATLGKFYSLESSCAFLNNKLYLTGVNYKTGGTYPVMVFSGIWNTVANFNMHQGKVDMMPFNNKLYFTGSFDSIGGNYLPQLAAFDGSGFSSAGYSFSGSHFFASTDIDMDTMYMTSGNKILKHVNPNTWSVYFTYQNATHFNTLAIKGNVLYVSVANKILMIKNGLKIDSVVFPNADHSLGIVSHKDQLFIREMGSANPNIYQIKNSKDARFIFRNEIYRDSNVISFVKNSNRLYYFGQYGVGVNGVDYRYMAEVNADVLGITGSDTIRGFVFWDKNKNNLMDSGDTYPVTGLVQNVNTGDFLPVFGGVFQEIVIESQNMDYLVLSTNFGSCVHMNFTGSIKSNNTKSGITTDSLYIPLRGNSGTNNIVLRGYGESRARLMTATPVFIKVMNTNCSSVSTSNGSVSLSLHPGTVMVNSYPAYSSRKGDVYTFNNLKLDTSTTTYIQAMVNYPNTVFSIGNTVRHYARLGNITGEDTMDNLDSIVQVLVYSFDPNVKHCMPEGRVTNDLDRIRYYIEFQNEGNDDAYRVTVVDTLNLDIPVYEFRMVGSSHPYRVSIAPGTNVVTWVFDNIFLKPKSQNEGASKGYVIFDAKLKRGLRIGDSIRNKAYIYFDYNKPIITDYAVVRRVNPEAGEDEGQTDRNVLAYPNPAGNFVNIKNLASFSQRVVIYDGKGAKVESFMLNGHETKTVQTVHWAHGIYMVTSEKGKGLKIVIK